VIAEVTHIMNKKLLPTFKKEITILGNLRDPPSEARKVGNRGGLNFRPSVGRERNTKLQRKEGGSCFCREKPNKGGELFGRDPRKVVINTWRGVIGKDGGSGEKVDSKGGRKRPYSICVVGRSQKREEEGGSSSNKTQGKITKEKKIGDGP